MWGRGWVECERCKDERGRREGGREGRWWKDGRWQGKVMLATRRSPPSLPPSFLSSLCVCVCSACEGKGVGGERDMVEIDLHRTSQHSFPSSLLPLLSPLPPAGISWLLAFLPVLSAFYYEFCWCKSKAIYTFILKAMQHLLVCIGCFR